MFKQQIRGWARAGISCCQDEAGLGKGVTAAVKAQVIKRMHKVTAVWVCKASCGAAALALRCKTRQCHPVDWFRGSESRDQLCAREGLLWLRDGLPSLRHESAQPQSINNLRPCVEQPRDSSEAIYGTGDGQTLWSGSSVQAGPAALPS